MKISEKQVDDVIVLDLQGNLMGGPEAVSLNDAINRFLDQQSLKLVINLSSVERVNSSGLGILIKALTTFKTNGGELKLAHVNENMENLLAITKLNTILESYDTEDAMRTLSPLFKDAVIISLQNGLGNEDIMSRYVPRVLGGTTSHGITKDGAGRIIHAGLGRTVLGNYQGAEDSVSVVADALNGSGIETETANDIRSEIWKKAIVNAGINPVTAITGQKNGFILENPDLEMTLEAICEEAVQVANAHGIDISVEESIEQTKEVARLTSDNKSSMLQDIERGKRTEIDAINGRIVEVGRKHGVKTPVNSALVALVKCLEEGRAAQPH